MQAQDWLNNTMRAMSRAQGRERPLPRLVGVAGRAGAGKDTAAGWLERHHSYSVLRFADPIKRGIEAMFGISPAVWEDRSAKEDCIPGLRVSPRYLAQTLGTDWGRAMLGYDVWEVVMRRRLSVLTDRRVVIPDVRFDNEARTIHELGGVVILIQREELPNVSQHVSERGIAPEQTDAVVHNNGTIPELQASVLQQLVRLADVT